jgi:hypothetical protein
MAAYPRRLIEVDLPIKRISAHARRKKSIRHGHISTLHIWWARRPLAACRAFSEYEQNLMLRSANDADIDGIIYRHGPGTQPRNCAWPVPNV